MKKWLVHGQQTLVATVGVIAETEEEAFQLAYETLQFDDPFKEVENTRFADTEETTASGYFLYKNKDGYVRRERYEETCPHCNSLNTRISNQDITRNVVLLECNNCNEEFSHDYT